MASASPADNINSPKFDRFNASRVAYKVVNEQEISGYTLVPKGASGKLPVIVKFHGGSYVTGASLFPAWFPKWALDYCILHSAILVTGDYRLLPESTGLELLEDVMDFWTWTRTKLAGHLAEVAPGVEADLDHTIVYGESAGGYCAIQSALAQAPGVIKGVIATYPGSDPGLKREKLILGQVVQPLDFLDNHLKAAVPGRIVTAANPPARMDLAASMQQQRRVIDFFGTDDRLYPSKMLAKAEQVPPIVIFHGRQDTMVPVEWSQNFVDLVKLKFGDDKINLVIEDGEHGFDIRETLDTPWLKAGLEKITTAWLE